MKLVFLGCVTSSANTPDYVFVQKSNSNPIGKCYQSNSLYYYSDYKSYCYIEIPSKFSSKSSGKTQAYCIITREATIAHALLHRNQNIFFKLGLFLEENQIEIYMRFR